MPTSLFLTDEEATLVETVLAVSLVQLDTLVNIEPVCKTLGVDPNDDEAVDAAGDKMERIITKLRKAVYQSGFTGAA